MRVCPNCGYSTDGDDNFCPYCGNPLMEESDNKKTASSNISRCNNCGSEIEDDSDFCPFCGNRVKDDEFDTYFSQDDDLKQQARKLNTVKVCPRCQQKYNSLLTSCPNCGYGSEEDNMKIANINRQTKEAVMYLVLCIIFGIIGVIITAVEMKRLTEPKAKKIATVGMVLGVISSIFNFFILFIN